VKIREDPPNPCSIKKSKKSLPLKHILVNHHITILKIDICLQIFAETHLIRIPLKI